MRRYICIRAIQYTDFVINIQPQRSKVFPFWSPSPKALDLCVLWILHFKDGEYVEKIRTLAAQLLNNAWAYQVGLISANSVSTTNLRSRRLNQGQSSHICHPFASTLFQHTWKGGKNPNDYTLAIFCPISQSRTSKAQSTLQTHRLLRSN